MWRNHNPVSLFALLAMLAGLVPFTSQQKHGRVSPGFASDHTSLAPQAFLPSKYLWHTFYGASESDTGNDVAVDKQGNIYVVSSSEPGWLGDNGQSPLHSHSGGYDIVVIKLNSSGVYQWHTFLGCSSADFGDGIALDNAGNIFIVGSSALSWYGDGSINPLHEHSQGSYNLVIVKLSQDGAYQWHTFYGLNGSSAVYTYGKDIDLDPAGNPVVVSYTNAAWQGDQGASPLHDFSGGGEIAVIKLSGNGAYQWHTFYGSSSDDNSWFIDVDASGNVWVPGTSEASWLGNSDEPPLHAYSGGKDMVVLKLNSNGGYLWHTFYGSSSDDGSEGLSSDGLGGAVVAGYSTASWQAPGPVNPLHVFSGGGDIVVLKLNSAGGYQWHTFYGSGASDGGNNARVSERGDIYVLGSSEASWQGNGNTSPLHPAHANDLVLLKLTASGSYLWHTFYGSGNRDWGRNIALDSIGNILISGASEASWLGDGNAAPLHPFTPSDEEILVLKFAGGQYFLPLLQR